ncbi:Uncharacterised protein [Vibrio cholerae]|nr:Uncharacterised protein [Vibrio cholerae]
MAIAKFCSTSGNFSSSKVGMRVSIRRITAPGNSRWKNALTRKRPLSRTTAKFASRVCLNSACLASSIIACNKAVTSATLSASPCARNSPSTRYKIGAPTVMYRSDAL